MLSSESAESLEFVALAGRERDERIGGKNVFGVMSLKKDMQVTARYEQRKRVVASSHH